MSVRFRGFGLRFRSALWVPEAVEERENGPPDVEIDVDFCCANVGNKPRPCTSSDERKSGPYRLTPDSLLFTMPGVARYRCRRDGRQLTVEPEPHATEEELAGYLTATALPALLWLRGETVLHAAAAVPPGCEAAVALAGRSGLGKSTLLRRLLEEGAGAVSDDSLAVRLDGLGRADVSGLPGCTQLVTPDSVARTLVAVPMAQQVVSASLACVVELDDSAEGAPRRLHGAAALDVLLGARHRPRIPRLLGMEGALLPQMAALAGAVRVYRWGARAALRCSSAELGERVRVL